MKMLVPTWSHPQARKNLFHDFDNVFESFFNPTWNKSLGLEFDIQESDKFILLSFDLPGLDEKDINVEVKNSLLTISGERKKDEDESLRSRYSERTYGSFKRTFSLPENILADGIEADYTQGVLKLLLPKREEVQPKKIEVQSKKGNLLSQLFKGKETA